MGGSGRPVWRGPASGPLHGAPRGFVEGQGSRGAQRTRGPELVGPREKPAGPSPHRAPPRDPPPSPRPCLQWPLAGHATWRPQHGSISTRTRSATPSGSLSRPRSGRVPRSPRGVPAWGALAFPAVKVFLVHLRKLTAAVCQGGLPGAPPGSRRGSWDQRVPRAVPRDATQGGPRDLGPAPPWGCSVPPGRRGSGPCRETPSPRGPGGGRCTNLLSAVSSGRPT